MYKIILVCAVWSFLFGYCLGKSLWALLFIPATALVLYLLALWVLLRGFGDE